MPVPSVSAWWKTPVTSWNTSLTSAPWPASSARAASMSDTTSCRPCAEPGAAEVTPVPKMIEHAEPGGVSCTTRKSARAKSASSRQPSPGRSPWPCPRRRRVARQPRVSCPRPAPCPSGHRVQPYARARRVLVAPGNTRAGTLVPGLTQTRTNPDGRVRRIEGMRCPPDQTCDRCGPAVRAAYGVRRDGELYRAGAARTGSGRSSPPGDGRSGPSAGPPYQLKRNRHDR